MKTIKTPIVIILIVIMLIASMTGIAIGQDSLDAVSGNTVTQSRLADIVANDYNSKSVPEQQTQVTLSRVTGNSVPQSRTADIVSYDIANSYDGSSGSSSSYVPTAPPIITSAPQEITNIPLLDIIPTPTATPAPTPAPTITPSKGIRKAMADKGIDYDLRLSGPEPEVLWGNFCFNVTPVDSEIRIKGIVHTQLCPSRDFKPGLYLIEISHEGYINFSKEFPLDNEELKNITVNLQAVKEEIPVIPAQIPEQNGSIAGQTQNDTTIATPASQPNDGQTAIMLAFISGMAIATLAGMLGFRWGKKITSSHELASGEEDIDEVTSSQKTIDDELNKIYGIIKNNPGITDEKILSELDDIYDIKMSGRTLTRRKAELKKNERI